MLLNAYAYDSPTKGTLVRTTFIGGEVKTVKPPFQPFFYSEYDWPGATVVRKRRLSDLSERQFWRAEFPSDNIRWRRSKSFGVIEGRVNYMRRLAAQVGFKLPSNDLPYLLSWDLESVGDGVKPNPTTDILRSVAAYRHEGVGEPVGEYKEGSEAEVASWFVGLVRDVDPDVLIDYNGAFYDMPLMQAACRRQGIRLAIGRDGSEPYIKTWDVKRRGRVFRNSRVTIAGRVHFDAYKETAADQGLYDLKNRRLNTVAKHFGLKPIEGVDHRAIPADRLAEVNIDDARVTFGVAQVYLPVLYELCDSLRVPLNMMVERTPSFIAELIYMDEFDKLGIISDGINADRFPWAFSGQGKAYQGADVRSFIQGLIKPIDHSDYASFYPNIMAAGNFSPETCKLLKLSPYTGKYMFKRWKDYAIYEVPDTYRGQVRVRVDISEDSIARRRVMELLDLRSVAKANWKATKEPKYWSQSWALKIMANAMYGYHGMRFSLYGNILVAILTTAMARYIIKNTMAAFRKQGHKIVEVDTDGFWWFKENEVVSV